MPTLKFVKVNFISQHIAYLDYPFYVHLSSFFFRENILILQYSTSKSTVVGTTVGIQGLPLSEQVRRVTNWRRERRWEVVELKDHQQ